MNYAKMTVVGNIASDAKFTPNTATDGKNNARANFVVVVNWHFKAKGEGDHTNYPVTVWGKYAENLHTFLKTGKQVLIEGTPQLYDAGALASDPNKTVRGFNLRADNVVLGNDSQKAQQASGKIVDPNIMKVIQVLAKKNGVSIEEILADTGAPAQPKAQAAAPAGDENVPFGQ